MQYRINLPLIHAVKAITGRSTPESNMLDVDKLTYLALVCNEPKNISISFPNLLDFSHNYIDKLAFIDGLIEKRIDPSNREKYLRITRYLNELFMKVVYWYSGHLVRDKDSQDAIYFILSLPNNVHLKWALFDLLYTGGKVAWANHRLNQTYIPDDMSFNIVEKVTTLLLKLKIPALLGNTAQKIQAVLHWYRESYRENVNKDNLLVYGTYIELILKTRFQPLIQFIRAEDITLYLSSCRPAYPGDISMLAFAADLVFRSKEHFSNEINERQFNDAIKEAQSALRRFYADDVLESVIKEIDSNYKRLIVNIPLVSTDGLNFNPAYANTVVNNNNKRPLVSPVIEIASEKPDSRSKKPRLEASSQRPTKQSQLISAFVDLATPEPRREVNHTGKADKASNNNNNIIESSRNIQIENNSIIALWKLYRNKTKNMASDEMCVFMFHIASNEYVDADRIWEEKKLNSVIDWDDRNLSEFRNFLKALFILAIDRKMWYVMNSLISAETIQDIEDEKVVLLMNLGSVVDHPESFYLKLSALTRDNKNIFEWFCEQKYAQVARICNKLLAADSSAGELTKIAAYILNKYDLLVALLSKINIPAIKVTIAMKLLQVPKKYCPKIYQFYSDPKILKVLFNYINSDSELSIERKQEINAKLTLLILQTEDEELVHTLISLPLFKNIYYSILNGKNDKHLLSLEEHINATFAGQRFIGSIIAKKPAHTNVPKNPESQLVLNEEIRFAIDENEHKHEYEKNKSVENCLNIEDIEDWVNMIDVAKSENKVNDDVSIPEEKNNESDNFSLPFSVDLVPLPEILLNKLNPNALVSNSDEEKVETYKGKVDYSPEYSDDPFASFRCTDTLSPLGGQLSPQLLFSPVSPEQKPDSSATVNSQKLTDNSVTKNNK